MEPDFLFPSKYNETRPWGSFERFTLNEVSSVKILHVSSNQRLSLQKHVKRSEFWKVIAGSGTAQINEELRSLSIGDEVIIPVGALHRLTGGEAGIAVLEICIGEFDENDIERTEDDFGRTALAP